MKYSKCLTVFLSVTISLFILSVSIAVPILFRPFYYSQIDSLNLEAETDWSREQIVAAYDEMMDFCIGATTEFSAGGLKWSESGKDHFVDVRGLFLLDLRVALATAILLLIWTVIRKKSKVCPYRFWGHGAAFWGSTGLALFFVIIGVLGALDFNRAFEIFHKIFFPGKDNWLFDSGKDQIILILPEDFFRNCAIFVLIMIVLLCSTFIIADLWKGRKNNNSLQKKAM